MRLRFLLFKLAAMETEQYWRFRRMSQTTGTRAAGMGLAASARLRESVSLFRVGGRAIATTAFALLPPLIVILLTQSATRLQHLAGDQILWMPDWLGETAKWLTSPVAPGLEWAALPAASLGVSGIFVAVYFATVTFVMSSTYKDATSKLRNQIIRQPESRWYSVFFTQTVVYTALVLALPIVRSPPTYLTLVAVGGSAAFVVLSFARIWTTLFLLLEPTSIFPDIRRDLDRWLSRAYKLGNQSSPSPIGIRRANERIRDNLETLNDLVTLILDREYERVGDRGVEASYDPRLGAAIRHLRLLWEGYALRKHTVHSLIDWNPTRAQPKDWFLSSHSEVSIAIETKTALAGEKVVDELWFERRIADLIERLLSGRGLRSIESVLGGLPSFTRLLGCYGQFEELRLWLSSTTFTPMRVLSEYASQNPTIPLAADDLESPDNPMSREQHFALPGEASAHNMVDFVLLEAINTVLGYSDYYERMRTVLPSAPSLVVDNQNRPPAGKLVLQMVANLRDAIEREIVIEGERVTADIAIKQLVSRSIATETVDELELILSYLETEIWPWALEVGGFKSWSAGAALSRTAELSEKLSRMLLLADQLLATCDGLLIDTDESWPNTDTAGFTLRSMKLREQLELPIARLAITVDSAPNTERPDQFGWAYYALHENLVSRVLKREPGDSEEIRQKVSFSFWTGELATQRLISTLRHYSPSVINSHISEPYLKFLQLNGIALILSQATNDDALFAPFETLWTRLFSSKRDATRLLGRSAASLSSESVTFAMTRGGLERSAIEIRANTVLEELGVPRELFDSGGLDSSDGMDGRRMELGKSTIQLLRAVNSSHFEGMFYARWLRPCALAAGAQPPTEMEGFLSLPDLGEDDMDEADDNE